MLCSKEDFFVWVRRECPRENGVGSHIMRTEAKYFQEYWISCYTQVSQCRLSGAAGLPAREIAYILEMNIDLNKFLNKSWEIQLNKVGKWVNTAKYLMVIQANEVNG